jgi:hypothetical protein
MKDMQAHARKIRSDAAECLVLSNLVTEEKRHLFGRIAEHLNSLALEIETEAVTSVPEERIAAPYQHGNFAAQPNAPAEVTTPTDPPQQAPRMWRQLPWSLLVVLVVIAAAVLWTVSIANQLPKNAAASQDSARELASLLSEESAERKAFSDRLGALLTRLDGVTKELNDLKSQHAGIPMPSTRNVVQEDQSSGTEAKPQVAQDNPPAAQETGARPEPSSTSAIPAAAGAVSSAPANSSPASESTDQVGTVSASRTETDPRTIGPAGCTHFRSFDPVSGTYTTFDGRRRQCR